MFDWLKKDKELLARLGITTVTAKEVQESVMESNKISADLRRYETEGNAVRKPTYGKCGRLIASEIDFDGATRYYCGRNHYYAPNGKYIYADDLIGGLCTNCYMLKPHIIGKCGAVVWVEYQCEETWNTIYQIKGCFRSTSGDNVNRKTGAELLENFCLGCPKLKPPRREL
ncbi:MAG: hypothetical protein NWF00_12880 [Candidatus Bathyarchaeota archaeon]|nr:hypothetical protein [Candidatus Bathyarchaeota archaeon]